MRGYGPTEFGVPAELQNIKNAECSKLIARITKRQGGNN
jgi:hypothetical protein